MTQIHGFCSPQFKTVKTAFQKNFENDKEIGASFAAYHKGKLVVDLWAGHTNAKQSQEWSENTLVNVYSTTKIMGSLCLLMLVDRGLIDLEKPVAHYWPEFAQAGKENIPVKFILSHSTGLPGFDDRNGEQIAVHDLYDSEKMAAMLAAQKPWWPPGKRSGYQSITFSFLVGHLVKLVSGKSLGVFFREEIALPLNIDFFIGTPETHDERIADFVDKPIPVSELSQKIARPLFPTLAKTMFTPDPNALVAAVNSREWRACELTSSNGHGNARSVAQVGAILASGGTFNGNELLSAKTVDKAISRQIINHDKVLLEKVEWGLGFRLNDYRTAIGPHSFSWGGYGGSICVMDRTHNASAAYVMNKSSSSVLGNPRATSILKRFKKCL